MIQVILAKSYSDARNFLESAEGNWVAIETEYGHETIDESCPAVDLSLNHHGDLQHIEAPALIYKKDIKRYDNFIVSHLDLDVLFGILWTAGWLKKTTVTKKLSEYIAFADNFGFHFAKSKIEQLENSKIVERYLAIGYLINSWIINDDGKPIADISKEVHKLLLRIKDIILGGATKEQVALYKEWFAQQEKAAKQHLQEIRKICPLDNLFIFRAPFSLTTAYKLGDIEAKIIVQYNEQSKSISLSCFDELISKKYFGKDGVIEPLKKFFGEKAGGKKTIGGTPRDQNIQPEMLYAFIDFLYREYFNVPEIMDLTEHIEIDKKRQLVIKDQVFVEKYKKIMPSVG